MTVAQLGRKGKQAATKAFSGLIKQGSKQIGKVADLVKKKAAGQLGDA